MGERTSAAVDALRSVSDVREEFYLASLRARGVEMIGDRLLCERAAALELGQKPRTLRLWRDEGRGPIFTRIGKRVFYQARALLAYQDEQSASPRTFDGR